MNTNASHATDTLSAVTTILLSDTNYGKLTPALKDLHNIFAELCGVRAGDITDHDINLSSGKAVSTTKAAHCLLEIDRTRIFLRGIYQAICKITAARPNETIHILYAGCGPYATLLTPLTTRFTSKQVKFLMLDVNAVSLAAAHKLYDQLGLLEYVTDFVCADATVYTLPENVRIDIVISETMLNGLRKEPQLAIMNNLIPQLHPEAVFIPEEIKIDARLTRWQQEYDSFTVPGYQPERIKVGLIYCANRQFHLPEPVVVQIPASETHNQLDLFTEIRVFAQEVLTTYNCSLTVPLPICKVENQFREITAEFEYIMSENPGFHCTLKA
ncbi:hypothetical protein ACJVDH_07835 [Pedobacter sp. AW1-32]|uniref:hypothetical protein n=1 Tax=Pedobacter sp. AW1-32 TaxID=3383026 RepID=UPI003FF150CD